MSGIVLTAYDGAILGPIAKLLGWIMNGIYLGMYKLFGIENVGLSIILLTIVIYLCMLPLTIKQQKFSKLTQKMQPEIQEIEKKYKGKTDQASMQAKAEEQQLIYQKYGVSPTGSCVQLLIQMPILFALYRVFYNVPAYVKSVKEIFGGLVTSIKGTEGYVNTLAELVSEYKIVTSSNLNANNIVDKLSNVSGTQLDNYVIDILYKLPSDGWNKLSAYFSDAGSTISEVVEHMDSFNYFCMLNISDTPWYIIKTNFAAHNYLLVVLALLVPIVSYVSQIINMKMMPQANNTNDQMAQQMKTMNTMMPLISLFMCFTVPVGLGIYWIAGAVVRAVQQFFINRHIENLDLEEIIKKNQEKAKKRREKMGIAENQIRNAASINTRTIESKAKVNVSSAEKELQLEKAAAAKSQAKPGSMAAKANMVKEFNERNSRK